MKYIFFCLSLIIFSNALNAKVIEKIVAIVNSEIITLTDINNFKRNLSSGGLVNATLLEISPTKDLLTNRKMLIDFLINEKILDSEVKSKDLEITFERVEQEIRSITKKNGISRSQLKKTLKQKGISFSEYQDFIKKSIQRQSLISKEITEKIKISDDDIVAYYTSKYGSKSNFFEYTIAHILILHSKHSKEKARERIGMILTKLNSNTNSFEDLAAKYSEDPSFTGGGLLGKLKTGEMLKEIEQVVVALSVNETSNVVKTRIGYHIVKLLKKSLIENPKITQQKAEIQRLLLGQLFKKRFRDWLDTKRKSAFIKIN
jgi:peptidyl-prolyl cis-trans isomerase SurA